jgi:hypothetical protein
VGGGASLTRRLVCTFQFLPGVARADILRSESLMNIAYCLYILGSPNLEGQAPVFISPKNRVAQLYPQALCLSN